MTIARGCETLQLQAARTLPRIANVMFSYPAPPARLVLFELTNRGMQLLNCRWDDLPALGPQQWDQISRGGWRNLVPEEYHPEVEKLLQVPSSGRHAVVEFPVYWQETTRWIQVFATALPQPEGGGKIVGLALDVTGEREHGGASRQGMEWEPAESASDAFQPRPVAPLAEDAADAMCHDLSGPLTSILVNCEMLLEGDCPPPARQKLERIFSSALGMSQLLRSHRRS
ncbi:MAG TPA: histidine kinase dimerization/phospho-acceptor domain-containing protein [Terriglobia bacterium]|nr:histidine kinase dimerization/phospho-acceptor domain-containing protein [Terriglobia bacterium]